MPSLEVETRDYWLGVTPTNGNLDVEMLGATDSLTGESGTSCSWSSLLLLLSP
jgi:hypothetical protein